MSSSKILERSNLQSLVYISSSEVSLHIYIRVVWNESLYATTCKLQCCDVFFLVIMKPVDI